MLALSITSLVLCGQSFTNARRQLNIIDPQSVFIIFEGVLLHYYSGAILDILRLGRG